MKKIEKVCDNLDSMFVYLNSNKFKYICRVGMGLDHDHELDIWMPVCDHRLSHFVVTFDMKTQKLVYGRIFGTNWKKSSFQSTNIKEICEKIMEVVPKKVT